MGYLAAIKLFFSNLSPKGFLYILLALIVIGLGSYGAFKYVDAIAEASKAKTSIITLTQKISEKDGQIKDLDQSSRFWEASARSKDGTIELLRGQMQLANDLRSKSEVEKALAEQKYKDIYTKYKNEKDSTVSPKLAKILNDLEKNQ